MSETEDYDKSATPTAHKSSHENAGSDEISVTGLSGLLGDAQTPLAHKTSHQDTGTDEISVAGLSGTLADDQHIIDSEAVSAMGTKANSNPLNHDRYADSEALAATVQAGAITDAVTKAPTHDAVYDVKVMTEAHKTRHQDTGADEISVTGLSGELADLQKPKDHTHQSAGSGVGGKIDHGLALDGLADDDHTQYIKHSLATAESDFLAASGAGAFVKKTLAETKTILGITTGADPGEGHITIFGINYNSIGQGTWGLFGDVNQLCSGVLYNSSNANGDNVSFNVYLAAGTYVLRILCFTSSYQGINDYDIDATEVASFDLYSLATAYNVLKTQTGIVIATSGLKTIKLRVHGKNGSSLGFYANFTTLALWRTA